MLHQTVHQDKKLIYGYETWYKSDPFHDWLNQFQINFNKHMHILKTTLQGLNKNKQSLSELLRAFRHQISDSCNCMFKCITNYNY